MFNGAREMVTQGVMYVMCVSPKSVVVGLQNWSARRKFGTRLVSDGKVNDEALMEVYCYGII